MFVFLMIGSSERDRRQEWEGGDWCGRHSMNHFDVCITASACMAPWLTCETRKALPAGSSRAAERGGVLSAPAVAGTGQRVDTRQCVAIKRGAFYALSLLRARVHADHLQCGGESETLYSNNLF